MNLRDDFFYQAVIYAKEKNYRAARSMLRNLLFEYPEDIEGLLLYSIVAPNREVSIQALKRILLINPDHEIAFNKLTQFKYPPLESIPTPTPDPAPTPLRKPTPQPKVPSVVVSKKTPDPYKAITAKEELIRKKGRRKINSAEIAMIGFFIIACLCVSVAIIQKIIMSLLSSI